MTSMKMNRSALYISTNIYAMSSLHLGNEDLDCNAMESKYPQIPNQNN
jgi:hypothetical protein